VAPDSLAQRIEVKRFEGSSRSGFMQVMGNEQFAVHQVDIRLDTAKAMIKSIQQRAGMFIIIVRMGARQGHDRNGESGLFGARGDGEEEQGNYGWDQRMPAMPARRCDRVGFHVEHWVGWIVFDGQYRKLI
jgi:hypothetical protein